MSSPPLWAPLKRSSTSVLRIPRTGRSPYSAAAAAGSGDGAAAAGCVGVKAPASSPSPDRDIGGFLKAVTGIAACGSGLGLWLASSNSSPSSSPVSSPPDPSSLAFLARDARSDLEEGDPLVPDVGQEKKPRYLFGDAYRRRVFFNYEKRIRMLSPPEKVFEYFASFRTPEGEVFMTPADLMRAVVPVFPPSESNIVREGYLRGERQPGELHCAPSTFFMLFDTNNDGLISFPEYIFFVTLLSIPESSFAVAFKMFDVDNNGEIEKVEFKKVMTLMRSYNRQGACHKDGLRFGLKTGKSVEDGGIVEYFFGKDGTECLQHDKFVEFLRDLHEEILQLEFRHYDCKSRGTISGKDFALSMVASSEIGHINKLLDRVEQLDNDPNVKDMRFTFEEFKAFSELRSRLQDLELALFGYGKVNGLLTKEDFQRAASNVCGIILTDNVVDVIFHVFDVNRDGNLSTEEFLKALHRRERDMRQPTSSGIKSRWLNCAKPSSSALMLP
ncbi:hypothetical protein Taro_048594 [Colocasia esculenta]|uniref:EF-hand domain-containing protein n=1 Tax=Colocasia esculenta TaxID=4460 RepID=A0A843X8J0_COLES|nr:hypothetical protein [Colocasia esculenta]